MCQWCDYWNAPEAAEVCLARLSRCELQALSATDISSILDLPSAVHTMLQFAKVKEKCAAWLLNTYSDVPKIIADDELLSCFCSKLSFAAVALWAEQDELRVHNENEVAVLLTFWCDAHERVSDEVCKQLSGKVRGSQMSKSFRYFILPKLEWFDDFVALASFNMAYDDGGAE